MTCPLCQDKGLIRVAYESGEPFDLAICDCRKGRIYRAMGEAVIRDRLDLHDPQHQIADRERFEGESVQAPQTDYLTVGKTKKAKL